MSTGPDNAALVDKLVELVRPILAPYSPEIRGAVLADLMAINLAGFQGIGKHKVRRDLLRMHNEAIQNLIKVNEAIIFGNGRRAKPQGNPQ